MNDLFNILIFSKDYNQGVIIQDYIKAIGYNSQVFDQEEAAYEGFLSRNFTLCIINHEYRHERNTDIGSHDQKFGKYHPCRFLV